MDYKLSGDPKEVEKVVKENRIRVARGVISFTPLAPTEEDTKDVEIIDSKELPESVKDTKTPKRKKR